VPLDSTTTHKLIEIKKLIKTHKLDMRDLMFGTHQPLPSRKSKVLDFLSLKLQLRQNKYITDFFIHLGTFPIVMRSPYMLQNSLIMSFCVMTLPL